MSKTFSLNGIRGRLLLLLLIVLIPVFLIEAFTFYRRFESRKSEEFQANLEVARGAAKSFDTFIQDLVRSELVIGLALTPSQPVTGRDRNRILDQFQADHPAVRSIFWMNAHGLVIASSLRSYVGYDLGDRSFFQKVKQGPKWVVSELIVGRATAKPGFTVSCGIRNEQGKLLGVVAASVEPDHLVSVLGIERSKEAGVSLVDNKGMIVFRYPPIEYTWEQRNLLKQYPMIEDSLNGKEVLTSVLAESTGKRRLVAFTPVSSIGWVAAAGRGEDEVMKAITSTLLYQAGLVFLVTLAGFGAALALARPITNSIIALRNHALALGRGETENLAVDSGPDELKDLAVAFNQMSGEVRFREEALRESEQRWVTTLASIGDAVIATDLSGKITFMNKVAEELTGWTLSEASTKPVADVFHIINEHTCNRVEDPVAKVLKEGAIVGLANHTILVKKDRTEVPIDDSGAPIRDREGKTLGVVLVFHDITERKRTEVLLQRQAELLHLSYDAIIVWQLGGPIESWNKGAEELYGYSKEEAVGQVTHDLLKTIHPEPWSQIEAKLRERKFWQGELKHLTRDGREIIVSARHQLIQDAGGVERILETNRNITERKLAEEALRESEEKYKELVENANSIIIKMDREGKLSFFNEYAQKFFGYSSEELLGQNVTMLIPSIESRSKRNLETMADNILRNPDDFVENINENVRKNGVRVWISWRNKAIRDASGYITGNLAVGQDITERKQAEEALQKRTLELQHLTETLEQRVKERTAELATLSSELLVAQEKERRRISYNLHDNVWQTLEIIRSQLDHLFFREDEADWPAYHQKAKQLIPVIRDTIARVRSMQGDLWPSVLDDIGIVATLEWYCREFGINHPGLGIEKNVGLAEDEVPASAKIVIYRVMQEALANVVKHSQANHVSLSLAKSDHRLEFFIKDDGVGFDPEEAIVKRNPWGGLGLRSMKERTELSGGLFGVDSAKGKGTTIRASWLLSGNN